MKTEVKKNVMYYCCTCKHAMDEERKYVECLQCLYETIMNIEIRPKDYTKDEKGGLLGKIIWSKERMKNGNSSV